MPNKEDSASRHRMVVEEIEIPNTVSASESSIAKEKMMEETPQPEILNEGIKTSGGEDTQETIKEPEKTSSFIERPTEIKKPGSPVAWILIPGIFILGAILGGIVFYQKGVNTIDVEPTPTPVSSLNPVSTPTPTPKSEVDVSEFDVAVYNGSGTAGEAGVVKKLLEDAGFNVVSTGNAATYDYTKTIIKAKASIDSAVIEKLKDALSENYVVGDSQTLSSSSTTDIQIVVGSSKAE